MDTLFHLSAGTDGLALGKEVTKEFSKEFSKESSKSGVGEGGAQRSSAALPVAWLSACAFQPQDMIALSQLEAPTGEMAVGAAFRVTLGETPAEFVHLYAGLERLLARVDGVETVTRNLMQRQQPYLLGVTSAIGGEGKTTTALHLALTAARSTSKRVCLVDLSLGGGQDAEGLGERLGLPAGADGLVAAVEQNRESVPSFDMPGCDNLTVIPGGSAPANPLRFARLPRLGQLLASTRYAFDMIVVDLPAVASENVGPLCEYLDGVLMVVRAGVTPREVVAEAIETVGPGRVKSVVLNRVRPAAPKWLQRRFGRV